mgnify:CR=1 FL=1
MIKIFLQSFRFCIHNKNTNNDTKNKKGLFSFTSKSSDNKLKRILGKGGPKGKPVGKGKKMRSILIGIFVVVLLAGAGVGLYFAFDKKDKDDESQPPTPTTSVTPIPSVIPSELSDTSLNSTSLNSSLSLPSLPPPVPKDEVYSTNRNMWSYDDAEAVCKLQNGELATYEQLVEAAEDGANWCNLGWVKSDTTDDADPFKYAHYPVQRDVFDKVKKQHSGKDACGPVWNSKYDDENYSIQGGAYNKNRLLAVNCYGPKRDAKIDEIDQMNVFDKGTSNAELEAKMDEIKDLADNVTLLPHNKLKWSEF